MVLNFDRKQQLAAAKRYAVYYGRGRETELSTYDLAIVEPAGQTPLTLKKMQDEGTLVFAYVSITEIPDYDPLKPLLHEADYLSVNGNIVANAAYATQLANLRSRNWMALLLHRIGVFLRNAGYDGLFLDTISNVEWPILPAGVRAEQQAAAVDLVRRIRKLHPEHLVIQNNGLETLCSDTAPYIDGICWENPDFVRPETYRWHEAVRLRLHRIVAEHGTRIMFLQEAGTTSEPAYESAVYWAKRERYLHYYSSNHYLEVQAAGSDRPSVE
jgi:endo-alpha-1,4-polygalactosaminidase (GH114 family)